MICILLVLAIAIFYLFFKCPITNNICGGSASIKNDVSFLKEYYKESYVNSWRVNLFLLKLRETMNVYCTKMFNIKEYLWQFAPKYDGKSYYKPIEKLLDKPPLVMHNFNKKFEEFFYTNAGLSKDVELFPLGRDLNVSKLDKMFKNCNYYVTKGACLSPLLHEGISSDKVLDALRLHNFDITSIDLDDMNKYFVNMFNKQLEMLIRYYKKLLAYDFQPLVINNDGVLQFKLKNPTPEFSYSNMIIEYRPESVPYYPNLFRSRNKVNTKLTGGDNDINKLLAIITLSHMPVFTSTHFRQNLFSIIKSPGLMTSPSPKINKQMRELPWVVNKDKNHEVLFWDDGSVPNYFLESYASPLNHNAEIFCSLFPTDTYANGCFGKFDESIVERFTKLNWLPRIIMANPPYTNEQFHQCNRLTDLIHKHHKTITVTTISRRDGTLFDMMMPEEPRPISSTVTNPIDIIMKDIIESPYYWKMYVVPEKIFVYACLFTDKEFSVASRAGERPTDTVLIIKSTDKDESRLRDIEKLFVEGLKKDESLRIEDDKMDVIIDDIEKRRDIQKIDKTIMNREFIRQLIKDMNLMVSGRS